MKVLITGATGFLGKTFVKYLIQQKPDYEIYCTYRETSKTQDLEEIGIKLVAG